MTMTVRGRNIVYTCLDCSHEWVERRLSRIPSAEALPAHEGAHRAVQEICGARDLESLMAATRTWARRLTGADGVSFILRDGDECYYADEEAIAPLWKGQRFPMDACIPGLAMQHRQAVLIPDVYADPRVPHDAYRPTFVRSLLVVPVRKTDPVAAIGAYWQTECAPTEGHVQLLELLAEATSIALRTARG